MNNRKVKKPFKKRPCYFCLESMNYIDYKETELLKKFTSSHGKINPSRLTGTCSRHQRLLSTAIKRARIIALLPFVSERIRK
ncbi:30S ribosomal protein S18 [Mesomycoplasma molare]|uniref:Small ribosomal subunit protein bS18 n=1 Tax=Mesomycoplasma molare TaxID=171288 RepID=A0ABY5TY69_9BACT|nr:30S ribosomal protein S18 [Mesomycoplasma molare]UWD33984.1 30S ribosomal protein S18 [Mesomycoplasma molare]